MDAMLDVNAAWAAIESALVPLATETVALEQALGRVLRQPIGVDRDLPPFDRAAMDGYAVHAAATRGARRDAPRALRVAGEATPGAPFAGRVAGGETVRIMTGAAIPDGCDAVVPVEDSSGFASETAELYAAAETGQHVVARASERRAGDVAFAAGHRVRAADIGALATVGAARVVVGCRPRIAVLSTGNELVHHATTPGPWSIRDSNGPLVAALARAWADAVRVLAPARDDPGALAASIADGLRSDLLILTGGVSMGAYDLVGAGLERAGVRLHFRRVALQPGKPTGFGTHAQGAVLALPGNPVSALTTFRLFASVALRRLEGESECRPRFGWAPAQFAWQRRNPKWLLVPGRSTGTGVERVDYRGSGDLLAYAGADCQIVLAGDVDRVQPGMLVQVWPL